MAYRDVVLADTPTDFYEMETSGVVNAGSGSRTGTLSGGVTTGVNGIIGKGWSFDGVNDSVSITPFPGGSAVANLTLEVWVKSNSSLGFNNGDYQEFIRRDGTTSILLRARGSSNTSGAGQAEFFCAGTSIYSGTRIDDGNWHHVVATVAGMVMRLYLDGVQVGTATNAMSVFNFGTGAFYIGSTAGTSEFMLGTLDNAAIYTSALSAARVLAHYQAAFVPGGYTAQPMTASATMTANNVKVVDRSVTTTPMTASATMPNALQRTIATLYPTLDYSFDQFGSVQEGVSPLQVTGSGISGGSAIATGVFKFNIPSNVVIDSATFTLYTAFGGSGTSMTLTVYPILADFNISNTSKSSFSLGTPTTFVNSTVQNTANHINVTSLLSQGSVYGFLVQGDSSANYQNFYTVESSSTTYDPTVSMTYYSEIINGGYTADPATASALMPSPIVSITKDVNFLQTVATASALMVQPVVTADSSRTVTAGAALADAQMPGGQFTVAASIFVESASASATIANPVVTTTLGIMYEAPAMTANAMFVGPLINGAAIIPNESDDDYFTRVNNLRPKTWWRLNDVGTDAVKDRVTGQTTGSPSGTYVNVLTGRSDAPNNRASVRFLSGSYIEQNEPTGSNTDETTFITSDGIVRTALEFSIRTDKANQFIMSGDDQTIGANGVASNAGGTELYMSNGTIGYRTYINNSGTPNTVAKDFTGFTNIADGEWHHIVIRSGIKSAIRDEYGIEIWIDGQMEIRRYFTQSWIGMPDYIGVRPAIDDAAIMPALSPAQYFVGDMTEVVWYVQNTLSPEDVQRNYYAFEGWKPVYADPSTAYAELVDASARGNQKKALYLYWTGLDEVFGGRLGNTQTETAASSQSFDPDPSIQNDNTYTGGLYSNSGNPNETVSEFMGVKVFSKSVTYDKTNNTAYRDPITDEQSLINLDKDVDLDDYDVIMFKDWPDEGYELDYYEQNYPGQKERLLNQIRQANDNGLALYVTNPRLAVDLGIVDSVEFVPTLTESKVSDRQGNASGSYDYKSALDFPWNIDASDNLTAGQFATGIGVAENVSDSYLSNKAYFYYDTNKNNRFRVRALIEGLTDVPSYMLEKAVWHTDYDPYGWQGIAMKYLKREAGLQIGDEYIFNGTALIDPAFLDIVDRRYTRFAGAWATPSGHVNAGTVVTTFGINVFTDKQELPNPYADYATTIVLEVGDNLAGRPVGGRIFVNFTEIPSQVSGLVSQVLPAPDNNVVWPREYGGGNGNTGNGETPAQQEWDYSWTRTTLRTTGTEQNVINATVTLPDGTQTIINLGSGKDLTLNMVRSSQLFPIATNAHYEMDARGMLWLASQQAVSDDDNVVRTTSGTANAAMVQPSVIGQKNVSITAQSFVANASMKSPAEAHDVDASIVVLPMTASAIMTGYSKLIYTDAATATATIVEPSSIAASGEEVVLTLRGTDITLYLKEEN